MRKLPAEKHFLIFFLLFPVFSYSVLAASKSLKSYAKPCSRLVLHLHEIIHQGNYTFSNATSAAITKNIPGLGPFWFGEMFVFDNPVTRGVNVNSPPVARARGFYVYNRKDTTNNLYFITLSFNSSEYPGSLTIVGDNEHAQKARDLSIIGGTGDFFMARGITTLHPEVVDYAKSYFRLKMDIKLYDCC